MEFTTLKSLPKAKKYLEENGFEIKKDNISVKGGRPAFYVSNSTNTWHLNDYELLSFANNDAWLIDEN